MSKYTDTEFYKQMRESDDNIKQDLDATFAKKRQIEPTVEINYDRLMIIAAIEFSKREEKVNFTQVQLYLAEKCAIPEDYKKLRIIMQQKFKLKDLDDMIKEIVDDSIKEMRCESEQNSKSIKIENSDKQNMI